MNDLGILVVWLLFLLNLAIRVVGIYVYVLKEHLKFVPPPSGSTAVVFPTKPSPEKPKALEEVLKEIEKTTEGPPIGSEETPVW